MLMDILKIYIQPVLPVYYLPLSQYRPSTGQCLQ